MSKRMPSVTHDEMMESAVLQRAPEGRKLMATLDDEHTFIVCLPDGRVETQTGKEVKRTARIAIAYADAFEAGDKVKQRMCLDAMVDIDKEWE